MINVMMLIETRTKGWFSLSGAKQQHSDLGEPSLYNHCRRKKSGILRPGESVIATAS